MTMRRVRPARKSALPPKSLRPAGAASRPSPTGPVAVGDRLAFALYAIGMIGGLGTITALIERAAP